MKLKLTKPRKIVSFDYSFMISLPHGWLKYHQIGKGDLVDYETDSKGNLIVSPVKND